MQNIMENRYSCRSYKNEKIDDEVIKKIIHLTSLTPSSLALEPWKFMVVCDKHLQTLSEICLNQTQVKTSSHSVIIISRNDLRSKDEFLLQRIKAKGKQNYEQYFAKVAQKTDSLSEYDMQNYVSMQCYMAVANLVNIAYSFNVKSCIIGGFDKQKLKEFINHDERFEPVLVVSLGLSDEKSSPKIRQNLDEIMLWKN